jgi:hypothetical protein
MPFPIIPILTAIPSILSAYKTVKDLDKNPSKVIRPSNTIPNGPYTKPTKSEVNGFKRSTAVAILAETPLLAKIKKRGGNEDDIGTLVDFACFIYKMVRGRK